MIVVFVSFPDLELIQNVAILQSQGEPARLLSPARPRFIWHGGIEVLW